MGVTGVLVSRADRETKFWFPCATEADAARAVAEHAAAWAGDDYFKGPLVIEFGTSYPDGRFVKASPSAA